MLCYTILYYTVLYYTMLCYAILYYTILYYTILYYLRTPCRFRPTALRKFSPRVAPHLMAVPGLHVRIAIRRFWMISNTFRHCPFSDVCSVFLQDTKQIAPLARNEKRSREQSRQTSAFRLGSCGCRIRVGLLCCLL